MIRESDDAIALRWAKIDMLREHYSQFNTFLDDVMAHLGFSTSWLQHDIGNYLQHGPDYLMVQAQRGQAKTTITAAYSVWSLIHDPSYRILIVSAAGSQASDISTLIVRIVLTMPQLECLRPDKAAGDRTSTENFDVHYSLKGVDKSASIACTGITGTLVGKRADLLIADDIESPKNSTTAMQREQLLQLTREFTSINSNGRIVYLGTPQSMESVYNTMPSRGFSVRIWPGRYPTPEQLKNYGEHLAPSIAAKIASNPEVCFSGGVLGDQGLPTDPLLMSEEALQKKERDQGKSSFQLQYMLSTALSDSMRYPLKAENLIFMRLGDGQKLPMSMTRGFSQSQIKHYSVHSHKFGLSAPALVSPETAAPQGICMYVDPAGGGLNGDENGYAVTAFLNGNIYLLDVGGLPGGYSVSGLEALAHIAAKWKVNVVKIEKNMGYGAFREVWLPVLRKFWQGAVEDDMVHGQKERRIIATLEPVMGRGALIVNEDIVESDQATTARYDAGKRITYSFFHQLCKITHDSGCLFHDDRLDAVEGAVRHWVKYLSIDEEEAGRKAAVSARLEMLKDPTGSKRCVTFGGPKRASTVFNRSRR